MKALHAKRLMKLARFLHNELPPRKFNFSSVIDGDDIPNRTYDCGTVACAVGWMPFVFPRRFRFMKNPVGQHVVLHDTKLDMHMSYSLNEYVLTDFFGTNTQDSDALFAPGCQYLLGMPRLTKYATGKQVASNIALYVSTRLPQFDVSLTP